MLKRRSFLTRIGAAVIALTLARHLPGIAPAPLVIEPAPAIDTFLRAGDVFTIEGKYRFNPVTRQPDPSLGLQEFTVSEVS